MTGGGSITQQTGCMIPVIQPKQSIVQYSSDLFFLQLASSKSHYSSTSQHFLKMAMLDRTQIGIKKTGTTCSVPNSPVAKMSYYFNCVCACVEADEDYEIRRLKNWENYYSLSDEEETKLFVLCLALSPDKLIGTVFIPSEDIDSANEFFELSAVNTRMVVTDSLVVGGQRKRVRKIMMFKKSWLENNYLEPMKEYAERGSRRQAIRAPPPRQRNDDCVIL